MRLGGRGDTGVSRWSIELSVCWWNAVSQTPSQFSSRLNLLQMVHMTCRCVRHALCEAWPKSRRVMPLLWNSYINPDLEVLGFRNVDMHMRTWANMPINSYGPDFSIWALKGSWVHYQELPLHMIKFTFKELPLNMINTPLPHTLLFIARNKANHWKSFRS